jgi:glycosyltransferase involved in cell wall biosynthesis
MISTVDPATGGPVEVIKNIAACLTSDGSNTVEIATSDPPDAPYLKEMPVLVHPCGPGLLKYGYSRRLLRWFRANHQNYDCVIVNGLWSYAGCVTLTTLTKSKVPYVMYTHGMLDPWSKRAYPLKHLKKWLYWSLMERRLVRYAKAVVFTCDEERRLARQTFRSYDVAECVIVNGTSEPVGDREAQRSAFLARYPELRGKRAITLIGRIHPKKGIDLAIKAFAEVLSADPAWHLVIVGPDEVGLGRHLEALAEKLNVSSRITWTGMLQGDLKWGAIHASEAMLLPSHQENFGIVIVEALACAVPVLISNKINIWREIEDAGAGMVREDDFEGTCSLLRSWQGISAEARAEMRQRARECFVTRFEVARTARTLQRLLEWAANAPGRGDSPPVSRHVQRLWS